MNSGWVAFLLVVVAGATGLALWAGANLPVAALGAAAAVFASGLLFVGAWLDRPNRRPLSPPRAPDRDDYLFRFGFRGGRFGREEVITTLDRIERWGPTPGLPGRSTREVEALLRLSRPEFGEYVRRRLDDLEART